MGTPEFAVTSLDKLFTAGYDIAAVVTVPDKPAGRGQIVQQSPVKYYAVSKGIPVLQPPKLKDPAFLDELRKLQADLQVVVAFRMLPEVVWNMPPLGTVNLHASLLPQYRGAAPINWAIINGEKETGVTTFFLRHEIDTGNMIFSEKVAIGDDETAGELHDRLMVTGAELMSKTVKAIEDGNYPSIPQPEPDVLEHAPKIFREDCCINWERPVDELYNFIRGLSPYPAAFTELKEQDLKIYQAHKEKGSCHANPGTFHTDGKTFLKVAALDGFIHIDELQLQGKKKMGAEEFLRGYRF